MELGEILQLILGVGLAVVGWFARVMWAAVQELKNDLADIKENLPIFYVRKDDFKEFRQSVMSSLQRIETMLYSKQDK
jgi:hypothetical protein